MVAGHLQSKNGYWYCVLTFKDVNGKPKAKWIATGLKIYGNKLKAEKKLLELRLNYNDPYKQDDTYIKERKISEHIERNDYMLDELCVEWLDHIKPQVAASTYAGYVSPVKIHLLPYFKSNPCKVKEVKSGYIQRYIDNLYKKNLSHKTINNHRLILSGMFKYARILNEMDHDPLTILEPPKNTPPAENYYTADEVKQLIKSVKGDILEYPVTMACIYGLRRGEICGIKWNAIDFSNGIFSIKHTVTETKAGSNCTKIIGKDYPKNKKNRTYPLLPEIESMLSMMKNKQQELGIYKEDGYVYIKDDGVQIRPNYVTDHFTIHLKNHGFRHIRFHDLRHSCASVLIADKQRNVSLKDVQLWLGHSDIKSTMRYAHIADVDVKERTAHLIEELILADFSRL